MQSHRTMSRVKSVSSPPLLLMFLAISMALAAPMIPLGELVLVSGTAFYMISTDEVWAYILHACNVSCRSVV